MLIIEKQAKELKTLKDSQAHLASGPQSRQSDNRSDFWKEKNKDFYQKGSMVAEIDPNKKKGAGGNSLTRKGGALPPGKNQASKKALVAKKGGEGHGND